MNLDSMEFILEIIYLIKCRCCIALYCKNYEIVYFDSFGVEHVPKENYKFIGHKNKHI